MTELKALAGRGKLNTVINSSYSSIPTIIFK